MLFLAIIIVNIIVFSFLLPAIIQNRNEHFRIIFFFIFTIGVLYGHLFGFLNYKEPNLYEKHGDPRATLEEVIRTRNTEVGGNYWFENAKPVEAEKLEKYILSYTALRIFYDKYGGDLIKAVQRMEFWGQVRNFVVEKNTFESFAFYFSCIITAVYFSKRKGFNSLKKWIGILISTCFFLELELILEVFPSEGIYGYYFPNLAAFEKILLSKIMIIPLSCAIRAYYFHFKRSKLQKIEKLYNTIQNLNNRVQTIFDTKNKTKHDPSNEIITNFSQIEDHLGSINNFIEGEKKYQSDKENEKKAQSYFLMILVIVSSVLYQLNPIQEYILNWINSKDIKNEDYIKL